MHVHSLVEAAFSELEDVLCLLDESQYSMPSKNLFNATIGQHVRHIIELYQCLLVGYDNGTVNYDHRKRDYTIESNKLIAIQKMQLLHDQISLPDKKIVLEIPGTQNDSGVIIESNFMRELWYNLEHTIHHMALIRVGINELTNIKVSATFGVAPSTIKYRTECVQ